LFYPYTAQVVASSFRKKKIYHWCCEKEKIMTHIATTKKNIFFQCTRLMALSPGHFMVLEQQITLAVTKNFPTNLEIRKILLTIPQRHFSLH